MGTSNGLLFPTPPRLFQDEVAVALGLNQAIVLQQLVYWENIPKVGVVRDGHKWVYNTYKDWKENFKWWSIRTIQDIFLDLERQGIVISKQFESASGKMIKFYRVDRDRFDEIMAEKEPLLTHDVNSVSCPPSDAKSVTHDVNSVSCHDANSVRSLKEHRLQEKTKNTEESISFRNSTELEKLSSVTPPEIVSPLSVSELEPALQNSNGVMSTGYVEQVKVFDVEQEVSVILPPNATYPVTVKVQNAPVAAQVFAEILPAEPVTVKSKPKKAAAKPKVAKPPKAPHVFTQGELALIAELEAIDPNVAEAARGRCGGCRASDPWLISQIFLVTKARVPQLLWTDVAAVIGKSLDVKLLLTVYKAWVGKHIDPYNFGWLLEWYKAGGPPQYKSNGYGQQPQQQPVPAPSKPKIEFDDPLVISSTQWVMANPMYSTMSPRSIQLGIWAAMNDDEMYMFHLAEAPKLIAEHLAEKSAMKGKE